MISWIKNQFIYFLNRIQFLYFKIEADKLHKLTGKRYFVIPKSNTKLGIVDNDYVWRYNKAAAKRGYKKITIKDLLEQCYYCTNSGTTSKRKSKSFNKSKTKSKFAL